MKKFGKFNTDMYWNKFLETFLIGAKCYVFFWLLLSMFRLIFVIDMHSYMSKIVTFGDIKNAFILGMQMSMQTVGILTLVSLSVYILVSVINKKWSKYALNTVIVIQILVLSTLFIARFPFYRIYHSGFNRMLFTAVHEDWQALFWTFMDEFNLPVRLLGVLLLIIIAFYLWRKFLNWNIKEKLPAKYFPLRWRGKIVLILAVYLIARLSLFSGSWSWQTQIDWENSAITKDNFLNEAILDDGQALYRAYCLEKRNTGSNGLSYTADQVRHYAQYLSGKNNESSNLDYYLEKKAQGSKIDKPKHIFLIISESYANWPLLPEYADLHLADGIKSLTTESNTAYCNEFLPNGSSTVNALMGIVTNFADANLYLTTMVNQMKEPYSTATAPQMKRLGYKTNFYYAGPSSWENIQNFTLAQGFDKFYSRSDIHETTKGSVWGADDKDLYSLVEDATDDSSSFNVILNVSNHSPFEVDLKANGFDSQMVKNALPEKYRSDDELLKELGHFYYADKMMRQFIDKMKQRYPDSLFIIVGDHADRYNIEKSPTMYKRYVIPFIVNGQGITKDMFSNAAVGSQIDIIPTLMELIAPKGFTYYSVGKSLTENNKIAVNYAFWLTDGYMGRTDAPQFMPDNFSKDKKMPQQKDVMQYANAIRAVSWWRAQHGSNLPIQQYRTAAKTN